jgi:hypothetical protein
MRNLGSSVRKSKSFSSGEDNKVNSGGGPSNKDWTSPVTSVMKEVDAMISLVTFEGGPGLGTILKTSSSMSSWNLLFWSRYFHFLVGK